LIIFTFAVDGKRLIRRSQTVFYPKRRYGNQARSKVKDSRSRRFDLSAQMGNPFPQGFAGSNPARSTNHLPYKNNFF
jgi:hypothetical protein